MKKFIYTAMAVGALGCAVTMSACAGVTGGLSAELTPRNAYIAEAGVKVALAGIEGAAEAGRIPASAEAKTATYVRSSQVVLGGLRHAFDTDDLSGAAVELVALAAPVAQAQQAAGTQAQPTRAGDVTAAVGLFQNLVATYGEAQAVLKGDPAQIPAALTTMRGEVDLQYGQTLAALSHAATVPAAPAGG